MSARAWAVGAGLVLALLPSCGRRRVSTVGPIGEFPPHITAVSPAPRSFGVPYDVAPIWAQFDGPLDSTSIGPRTVFLKIDQARQAVNVRWNSALQRIELRPSVLLRLSTTYTVVIDTTVRSAAGLALASPYVWQFTTNSLHPITDRLPLDGATDESPFVTIAWSGHNTLTDPIRYDLYVGTDSVAVASHTVSPLSGYREGMMPSGRWLAPATYWWTLVATNTSTHERETVPVWRFTTLDPAAATIDSVVLNPLGAGTLTIATGFNNCTTQQFSFSPSSVAANRYILDWALGRALSATTRLAGARMRFSPTSAFGAARPGLGTVTLQPTVGPPPPCGAWTLASPVLDAALGTIAVNDTTAEGQVIFASDRLTAHLEASLRRVGYGGYIVTGTQGALILGGVSPATMSIQFYRLSSRPRP